jgi:outer membrane protein OmpA-like peptidoglycan-associated protein
MSASLIDSLTGLFTPGVVSKAASMLGEPDAAIRKGVVATIPAMLGGIASRADDSRFGASLFELVQAPANNDAVLGDVGSLFSAKTSSPMIGLGSKLIGMVFGGDTSNFTSALSRYAGVKSSTASTLLSVGAPLVLAYLGKRVRSDSLTATSLTSLLRSQKDSIAAAVPGPLAEAVGLPAVPTRQREAYVPPVAEPRTTAWRWLVPALAVLAGIIIMASFFGRDDRDADVEGTVAAVEPAPAPEPLAAMPAAAEPAAMTQRAVVYFDVDEATLPAHGVQSLSAVVDYLKANPGATATVSGYHDPTGDQAANEAIARSRAEAVRDSLVTSGIEESRIDMQKPVVTEGSGTEEQARRVEVIAG